MKVNGEEGQVERAEERKREREEKHMNSILGCVCERRVRVQGPTLISRQIHVWLKQTRPKVHITGSNPGVNEWGGRRQNGAINQKI